MSARLKRNFALLRELERSTSAQQKAVLASSTNDVVLAISEIINNILNGNIQLDKAERVHLLRHRHTLRRLADRRVRTDKKKALLIQRGGFLATLLGPALALVATLIGKLV